MVLSMERWKGKVAIVTGASAGIGSVIVERLVDAGVQVVGLARRGDKIEELAKKLEGKSGKLYSFAADMTKEDDVLNAFKWTKENLGPIHILVNNAGVVRGTNLIDGETKLWKDILDTNVLGLCVATREAVKDMRAHNVDGHIIHINSLVGHRIIYFQNISVYAASKYAVTALTETLRQELNSVGSKIKISSISPGLVSSDIIQASLEASGPNAIRNGLEDFLTHAPVLQASDVVDAVIYVLSTPPHVQVHELIITPFEK